MPHHAFALLLACVSCRKPQERISQLRNALAALQQHQTEQGLPPEACNVLVAGDFNSCPGEAAWQLMSEGELPAGCVERGALWQDTCWC